MANLLETAKNAGNFKTLIKVAEAAGLLDTIEHADSLTVFAPTDDAFNKLPQSTLDELLQDIPKLKRIVAYHAVFGDVRSDDLAQIDEAPTVEGSILAIESSDGKVKVNDANVLQTDILADNGVIHVIDEVLVPTMVTVE
ncbi:beta-Ig-H3/fasciclin [Dulcicalothrix desertica PCC 7102]|uniref:Beta-Ig-H3/fasciclin n=1 Tax=Dulcicalothrix desertica PCC 7102 TaxID=232991 RepID=A0A3S1CJF0_9CYAN|nr:fasciclin domain-containing protein [Dulcicalothrix desertica]RUT02746.1 beta-Ig-H3/fasciclin [Dulcicalothrix desertica PCC 7102]TWH39019.1 putative surface protein with fasciclin (FAS1) repeats [Dulcicalothrix desertica PCC 7102]